MEKKQSVKNKLAMCLPWARRVVLVAFVVAWPLSYADLAEGGAGFGVEAHRWRAGWVTHFDELDDWQYGYGASVDHGTVRLFFQKEAASTKPPLPKPRMSGCDDGDYSHWTEDRNLGIRFGTFIAGDAYSPIWTLHTGTMFPIWSLSVLSACLLAYETARGLRYYRRLDTGACPTCGYDIRAHKPGDKCPECGIVIASPQCARS